MSAAVDVHERRAAEAPGAAPFYPVALLAYLAAVWLFFLTEISPQWSIDPDYNYGWAVPFLFLFLLWQRWQLRPAHHPPSHAGFAAVCGIALAASILPVKLIKEANQDWLLPTWAITAISMGLLFVGAYLAGGAPWLKHFAPPIFFLITAAPWPFFLEHRVVLGLTDVITRIATEGLILWGIPAIQHGNVIEVPTGLVGIDEACSGIRSLQAVVMISLFVGAQFDLRLLGLLAVLVAGACFAFACNVVRSTLLAAIAADSSIAVMRQWHDTLGLGVLLFCFAGVWLFARLLARPPAPPPASAAAALPYPLPTAAVVCLLLWIPSTWLLTEGWYRAHEMSKDTITKWRVSWPTENPTFAKREISEASRALLLYDEGSAATWSQVDGSHWQAFYFRWRPGMRAAQAARDHVPQVCLPRQGMELRADAGEQSFRIANMDIPFSRFAFSDHGTTYYVFRCVSNDLAAPTHGDRSPVDWSRTDRLERVLNGKRQRSDQRILEVVVSGYNSQGEADSAFKSELAKLVGA